MTKKICIVGVTGLVGANLAKKALSKGYLVNGTARNASDEDKIKYIKNFPNSQNLTLFSANMNNSETFDEALADVDALFICCLIPIYKSTEGIPANQLSEEEGRSKILAPTVEGCLNILHSAKRNKIRNVLICSSTASTNPNIHIEEKNEIDHWSDESTQIKNKKFTSAAKTVMEKRAIKFCEENNIRLCILLPTGLYGELLIPGHLRHNPYAWLDRLLNGGEPRHAICPDDSISMIHTEDLAELFLNAFECDSCEGRFFGVYESLHWEDIYKECERQIPDMITPKYLDTKSAKPTAFDFARRDSLGVKLRDFPTMLSQTLDSLKKYQSKKVK
ncbi:MAG: hypothetical protein CBC29_00575 [Methylococcaceae bacterium TMED69]|nr:MAG: hypothetical protein CBC29_00575 [Methylococcaceae bacterium TMED69]|tara:strand:+ start:206 stop:1204 length:999 start_codon:yes stop_codon:yes gene_type:complete